MIDLDGAQVKGISMNTTAENSCSHELALELYRQMYSIRYFETRGGELCRKGEIPAFIHLYVGEEAVAVGVCSQLHATDFITSTHRGHGHVLAKGANLGRVMAELYGRADGYCGGRGGSMHIFAPEIGLLCTNGLVAGGIPSAVGAALTARVKGSSAVAVAFFGDGASNHGAFHESLNLAASFRLPVIFVCENNLYATATPLATIAGNPEIAQRAVAYGMPGEAVDGQDVLAVRDAAARAIARARAGEGPTLLECKTYRFVGHNEGDPVCGTYRTAEEVEQWKQRCPLLLLERYFTTALKGAPDELEDVRRRVTSAVEDAITFARNSPWPSVASLEAHRYAE